MWNLRLGAVYGPDRRPCPLWPLVELFSEDVENKIAELLAPQPRLPTPQYYNQIKPVDIKHRRWRCPPHSQWRDAVSRFIDNYFDSQHADIHVPQMVFVDWDDKGRATIDLSRALDSDEDDSEADDSDDEHMSDDSDDDSYPDSETHAFCEVCDGVCANVTWYIHPHSYHPQGRNLYSACPACIQLHSITGDEF